MTILKSGFVAFLGRPNVGKSTLFNQLIQEKLAAISPRPQTTRHQILGILHGADYQAVLLDCPGIIHKPRHGLDRRMVYQTKETLAIADLAILMVLPRSPGLAERRVTASLKTDRKATILVINKIDTIHKPSLLPIIQEYKELHDFLEIIPISAKHLDGIDLLTTSINRHLPPGEARFPSNQLTNATESFLIGELVREQIYHLYRQEIPYATAVDVEVFEKYSPDHGGKGYILATIYVENLGQKKILIGHGGIGLKSVGTQARIQAEALLGTPLFLELRAEVHPAWRQDPLFMESVGY